MNDDEQQETEEKRGVLFGAYCCTIHVTHFLMGFKEQAQYTEYKNAGAAAGETTCASRKNTRLRLEDRLLKRFRYRAWIYQSFTICCERVGAL